MAWFMRVLVSAMFITVAIGSAFSEVMSAQPLSPVRERTLKPQDSFKECDACPEMVVVPAGSFTMGSLASEPERSSDEGPQHQVTFLRPFAVGRFSVTFAEWDACVADGGCNGYKPFDGYKSFDGDKASDPGWGRDKRPVINVAWNDAKAYLEWLSRKTGKTYRLLSESEREYVARAGTTTPFWWGSTISTQQANYDGNYTYGGNSKGEFRQKTMPVDSFQPNPWGLFQVHGNVWEWTADCRNGSYNGAPTDGSARTSGNCDSRVLRGGSWISLPSSLRSAVRVNFDPALRFFEFGFRVARTLLTP
jgi:formylglycine-generating enzyme required for sulfatase activity